MLPKIDKLTLVQAFVKYATAASSSIRRVISASLTLPFRPNVMAARA